MKLLISLASRLVPITLLCFAAALVAIPITTIIITAASGDTEVIGNIARSVLPRYIITTIWILIGSGIGCLFWGVICAGLVTWYQFPARNLFCWALALPLAIPSYISAFVYTQFTENPIIIYLGIEVRSLGGIIALFSFSLFPYVFLLTRVSLTRQSQRMFEAGRVLGFSPRENFLRLALPCARPAIVAGCTLAMLEALNDFGTVRLFALETVSTAIYEVWWLYGDKAAAAQIAIVTLIFVLVLLLGERATRQGQGYTQQSQAEVKVSLPQLTKAKAWFACLFCLTPLVIGFIIPCLFLIQETFSFDARQWSDNLLLWKSYASSATNSLLVAGLAAIATTALGFAIVMLYKTINRQNFRTRTLLLIAGSGYAIPGTMLAMGTLIFILQLQKLIPLEESIILNSILILIFIYIARFLTIALSGAESASARLKQSLTDAARVIGMGSVKIMRRIHIPLLRGDLIAVALIVFIDGTKELSATFLLRPFDFDTLATKVYDFMREEQVAKAAPGALAIIILGVAAILLLASWAQERSSTTRLRLFR